MLETRQAKRVKRSQLFRQDSEDGSSPSSRAPSPESAQQIQEQDAIPYSFEYEYVNLHQPMVTAATPPTEDPNPSSDAQSFQFRLFSKTPRRNSALILTRSPTPSSTLGLSDERIRFLNPHRPRSYYFTSAIPEPELATQKAQYASAAVDTSDVIKTSTTQQWPGTALPWRVVHLIPPPGHRPAIQDLGSSQKLTQAHRDSGHVCTKPSKKRRILRRRRFAEHKALLVESQARRAGTAEAEREKRTRRNREKKVKRKEREKRKKMGQEGGAVDVEQRTAPDADEQQPKHEAA